MSVLGDILRVCLFESIITSIIHEECLEKIYNFSFSIYVEEYIDICGELVGYLDYRINQNLIRK